MKNLLKKAYTLAEVIIVILIIAVVVSVTIKLTKAKLDNITSYTYYSAYNAVRAVAAEMVRDFDPEEDDYGVEDANIALKIKNFFASNFSFLPCWATSCETCPSGWHCNYSTGTCMTPDKFNGDQLPDTPYIPVDPVNPIDPVVPVDPIGGDECNYFKACSLGQHWDRDLCKCIDDPDTEPDTPDPGPGSDPVPSGSCPAVIPCGKQCSAATGYALTDIAGFSRTCPDRAHQWSEEECGCIPVTQTVSRSGEGFCRLFVNYSNTAQLAEDDECQGDHINNGETNFADKEPDMILRNGMILYNVSQDPGPIAELAGNSKGVTYIDAQNREIDVDTWGYKLYVDIDGLRGGNGTLWEDVYPFYVTLSGTVIPAYDIDNPETAGGDSRLHLQTSVYDEFVDANGRHTQWITKSTTFKESACTMGYVNSATPYCQGIAGNNQCAQQNHDCRIKTVMPIKFFGF